ncbi:MAG: hypothetical protein AAF267_03525 [Deinococcota bacterium]
MSIVDMQAVALFGSANSKDAHLAVLQSLGFLHLISWEDVPSENASTEPETLPEALTDALTFLRTCPQQRKQLRNRAGFDASEITREVLALKPRLHALEDERDELNARIKALKPWGNLQLPPLDELGGICLWFYEIPHPLMRQLANVTYPWQCIHKDNRLNYVVVLSQEEPEGLPVQRTRTGYKPLSQLEMRLEQVESSLEDLEAERSRLTRWRTVLADHLDTLEDAAARRHAANFSYEDEALFVLRAWCPLPQLTDLEAYADQHGLALTTSSPEVSDTPPTLLTNSAPGSSGQDLVTFYMTPNYWLWDPSTIVLYSFAIFFAVILSDAGYAAVLGLILAMLWRRLGRSPLRRLLSLLVMTSLGWGVLAGSYFGYSPPAGTWLAALKVVNVRDSAQMIPLTVILGASHLALANALTIRETFKRFGWSWRLLSPTGWIISLAAGLGLYLMGLTPVGIGILATGLVMVASFAGAGEPLLPRILNGAKSLTSITSAFGDTLSYLRLFALGLASASLAITWNDLAAQAAAAQGPFSNLAAALIFLLGHTLNFVLALVSGVVHGLRLNFIEFFNWSITEEGTRYNPFQRQRKHSSAQ